MAMLAYMTPKCMKKDCYWDASLRVYLESPSFGKTQPQFL